MAIIKLGENLNFSVEDNLLTAKEALNDKQIALNFIKMAKKLKQIAPRAEDFLYGHAIMMHAAEASLVDQETGEPLKNKKGKPVKGAFESFKYNGKDSVKWVSADGIMPYKNANGDIFPEAELLKAYKLWVGKPLCKDHKSDSVDGIRGIVIDTYYDPTFKRVHALFALDRKNYADLARKVETGYANCVSMGTAVGRSVCTECGNPARTEREYCQHIKARANYGEINLDLSPIELSLVVNGADGRAKIRNIVASMNNYVQDKQARIDQLIADRCVNPTELQSLAEDIGELQKKLTALTQMEKVVIAADVNDVGELIAIIKEPSIDEATKAKAREKLKKLLGAEGEAKTLEVGPGMPEAEPLAAANDAAPAQATMGGGEGYAAQHTDKGSGKVGWPPFEPSRRLAKEGDTQGALSNEIRLLRSKVSAMTIAFNELKKLISKEENNMNSARLRARAKARRAYWLGGGGVNEPTPGKPKYEKEEADKIRDTEDKQMVGEPLDTGSEGLHPGDEGKSWETRNLGGGGKAKDKKKADVEERQMQRQALVEQAAKATGTDTDTTTTDKLDEKALKDRAMKRRAYWLGGGGLNEPTPGKPKYPKEEADKIRDNEDKHLQGVTNMGGTDGMVPGDEKVKKQLLRASLSAKFTKVADAEGKLVKDASRWDLYAGDKLLLSATAGEIFEDEIDAAVDHPEFKTNWDYLASKQYGQDLIRHVRKDGLEHVAYLLKGAQPPVAPAAAPAAPAPEMAPPPAAPEAAAPAPEAAPAGNKDKVNAALSTMEEKIAELRELVGGGDAGELVDVDVAGGGKAEKPAPSPMEGALAAFRDEALRVEALLNESADELALISEALEGGEPGDDRALKAVAQALEDSQGILVEADLVLEAAKKKKDKKEKKEDKKDEKKEEKAEKKEEKAEEKKDEKKEAADKLLEEALRLRAENRAAMLALAMGDEMGADYALSGSDEASLLKLLQQERKEKGPEGELMHPGLADDGEKEEEAGEEEEDKKEKGKKKDKKDKKEDKAEKKDEEDDAKGPMAPMCAEDHAHGPSCGPAGGGMPALVLEVAESNDAVLAARKAERDALLKSAGDILGKYELDLGKAENATEPTYFEAHPGGKGTVTELSHTKTQEAKVETISEVHDVMRDVAESEPRNVRDAAAVLQEAIVKGALKVEDIDRLVAEGKVDGAAASYWKKYFAQAPGAGSFGADLSKEFASKKKEASVDELRAKMRRAYAVGLQAQEKGVIASTNEALDTYVDELMNLDDAGFESIKRIMASVNTGRKTSGSLPRVGEDGAAEPLNVTAAVAPAAALSMFDQLSKLGWK